MPHISGYMAKILSKWYNHSMSLTFCISSFLLSTSWSDICFLLYSLESHTQCLWGIFLSWSILWNIPITSTCVTYVSKHTIVGIMNNPSALVVGYIFLELSEMILHAFFTPFRPIVSSGSLLLGLGSTNLYLLLDFEDSSFSSFFQHLRCRWLSYWLFLERIWPPGWLFLR